MRRQDLLDQGRSSARHPDDKDRIGGFAASPAVGEYLCGERGNAAVDKAGDLVGGERLALEPQRIAPRVVRKRIIGAARVMHRLAEREIEVKAVLFGKVRSAQRLLHGFEVILVEPDRLQV